MFFFICRRISNNFLPVEKRVQEIIKPYKDIIKEGHDWVKNKIENHESEDVYIKSDDNLKLHGTLIEYKNAKGTIIIAHGYRSSPERDLYASTHEYYKMGYNILLFDQRATNQSEGKYITFGVKESNDIISWVKYLNKKYPKKDIILAGVSMGASAILMSMNRIEDNMNVKGIIADSAYISGYDEVKYCINHYFKIPGILFIDMINIWCKLIAKFDLKGKNIIRSMRNSKIPVLLIHGKEDDFVPPVNSIITFKKYKGPKKLLLFEKASHGISYLVKPKYYVNAVKEFLSKGE
jgi:fermentation-respiration switch protein FrsA (DUF1100 family)